jgi:hypothetical protein
MNGNLGTVPVVRSVSAPAGYLCGLTWDGVKLWHSDQDAGKIWALDPVTGAVSRTIDCGWVRADLTYHDGLLWQVGGRPKRLVLIDPGTGRVVGQKQVLPASGRLCGIEIGPEGAWMCLRSPSVLQLRDLETMTVQAEFPIEGAPSGATYAHGVVVYGEFEVGLLRAVDTATGELLDTLQVAGHPTGMAWDGEHIWYCDFAARAVKAVSLDVLAGRGRPGQDQSGQRRPGQDRR